MTFSLYALLDNDAPSVSNESLAADLENYFCNEKEFSLQFEQLPFAKTKTLALRWNMWLVRVSYEEGDAVKNDSIEIQKTLGPSCTSNIAHIGRRIRVVFGSDDTQQYTNQIIYVIDFLKEIKGTLIFDPQQNNFIT